MADANTKLLLHMNSDFSDSSASGHTPTVNGATIDTSIKKFGAGSGKFVAASSQYVRYPDSNDWNFGSGAFTIESQVRFTSVGDQLFVSHATDGNNRWGFFYYNTVGVLSFYNVVGGVSTFYNSSSWVPATNTQYHIALVRSGNTLYFFVEGVAKGTQAFSITIANHTDALYLGTGRDIGFALTAFHDGHLDEFRISDVARWTSGFTPPSAEYNGAPPPSGVTIFRRRIEGS